jgi:hypothetical protein
MRHRRSVTSVQRHFRVEADVRRLGYIRGAASSRHSRMRTAVEAADGGAEPAWRDIEWRPERGEWLPGGLRGDVAFASTGYQLRRTHVLELAGGGTVRLRVRYRTLALGAEVRRKISRTRRGDVCWRPIARLLSAYWTPESDCLSLPFHAGIQ